VPGLTSPAAIAALVRGRSPKWVYGKPPWKCHRHLPAFTTRDRQVLRARWLARTRGRATLPPALWGPISLGEVRGRRSSRRPSYQSTGLVYAGGALSGAATNNTNGATFDLLSQPYCMTCSTKCPIETRHGPTSWHWGAAQPPLKVVIFAVAKGCRTSVLPPDQLPPSIRTRRQTTTVHHHNRDRLRFSLRLSTHEETVPGLTWVDGRPNPSIPPHCEAAAPR
jgi:hypothetical protein